MSENEMEVKFLSEIDLSGKYCPSSKTITVVLNGFKYIIKDGETPITLYVTDPIVLKARASIKI